MVIKTPLTKADFLILLSQKKVTVIKAGAKWCGPCTRIVPEVDKLVEKLSDNIQVIYLDVDASDEVAGHLRITKLPTFISYVGKNKMDILVSSDINAIKKFFQKVEVHASF